MQEILKLVDRHTINSNNKPVINSILTLYVGCAASVVIENQLPLLVGALAMSVMSDKIE